MREMKESASHYERHSLVEVLQNALAASGLGHKPLTTTDLAQLDQFHSRGLAATEALAAAILIEPTSRVIDIGSGLGGPSRYLAENFGCSVHGIDLSESFVDAATFLAERAGLQDKVVYTRADACALPFPPDTFDLAWTQHVAMNIKDRDGLYAEIHRVLRPGAQFAFYDVMATGTGQLHYPVPWAQTPETSFPVTPDAMRHYLANAGFQVVSWTDCTASGVTWFLQRERAQASLNGPAPLSLGSVMGPNFATSTANLRRNLEEGRAVLIQAVCQKI